VLSLPQGEESLILSCSAVSPGPVQKPGGISLEKRGRLRRRSRGESRLFPISPLPGPGSIKGGSEEGLVLTARDLER